jgi:hypothetical protein
LTAPAGCSADNVVGVDPPIDVPIAYAALSYDASTDQLVVGTDRSVELFQAADGRKLQSIVIPGIFPGTTMVLARRAGGTIVASDYDRARIFDDAGNLLRTIVHPREGVSGLDLSLDGRTIATSSPNDRVRLVDTMTGAATDLSLPAAYEAPTIFHIRFSPDGSYLAADVPSTRVWRLSDGAVWADMPGQGNGIAFSAAGEIARLGLTTVDVFAVPSGTKLASYPTGGGFQPTFCYSPDGTRLALNLIESQYPETVVNVIDRANGSDTVKLFDDPQSRPPAVPGKLGAIVALTFAGPDRIAVAWDDGRLAAFRVADGVRIWSRVDSD